MNMRQMYTNQSNHIKRDCKTAFFNAIAIQESLIIVDNTLE